MTHPPLAAPAEVRAPTGLAAAFAVAYPSAERTVDGQHGRGPVHLSLRPKALIPLDKDRFALIAGEDDPLGGHADPGAVSVAYLQRDHARWRLVRRWDEVAWTGDSGRAADTVRPGPAVDGNPVAVVSASYIGQGQETTTGWLLALEREGPRLLGSVPMGGYLEPNACDDCDLYSYRGSLAASRNPADAFSIRYRGWTSPPDSSTKTPFDRRADYALQDGALVVRSPASLPGGQP
jgi:hypothetical protein